MHGSKYRVIGTSDYPVCEHCGKTNLTRSVGVENEFGDVFNVGVVCASKLLRQRDPWGKVYRVSVAAVVSMGLRAKQGDKAYLYAA
jgi:hypothetical protein